MIDLLTVLTVLAAMGAGIIGGVFFAFSTFVMRALAELRPSEGIAGMQAINRTVINPWFLGVFMGTALVCLALGAASLWSPENRGDSYLLAGSVLYVFGTFGVTIAFNVPMNDHLARQEADDPKAAEVWSHYLERWTQWNHVRTIAALLAALLLTFGFRAF